VPIWFTKTRAQRGGGEFSASGVYSIVGRSLSEDIKNFAENLLATY